MWFVHPRSGTRPVCGLLKEIELHGKYREKTAFCAPTTGLHLLGMQGSVCIAVGEASGVLQLRCRYPAESSSTLSHQNRNAGKRRLRCVVFPSPPKAVAVHGSSWCSQSQKRTLVDLSGRGSGWPGCSPGAGLRCPSCRGKP